MTDQDRELQERVRALRADFEAALAAAVDTSALQGVQDRFLGRRAGQLTELLKSLGKLPAEARRDAGQLLNALKEELEGRLESARGETFARARDERLRAERVDITLPGRSPARGRRHPLTVAREDLEDIFVSMGYEVYDGPEVEDDYHCFEALNMPPDHPARDMQDTFYLQGRGDVLLRTHTSSAQIRYMLTNPHPPYVRIICPGKVFRRDDDVTHSPMFQQVEALVVGPGITLGDLKGTVEAFLHALFGPGFPVRFRSSYFPYTEPSVEVDLGCVVCGGSGRLDGGNPCRVCKTTGWLEIMGSGVVHPAVFEAVNARLGSTVYDPEQVSGFAFGLGIDRVAMIRHGIDDIRLFYENDLRFLEQFPGMKVPLSWLREFVEVKVEVSKLAEDLTLIGLAVDGVETHGGDSVLDIDVTTNRVDCMNVYGVAREVSVLYRTPLREIPADIVESGRPAAEELRVVVEAADLCPRFCARVLDVRIGPSPAWLRERLEKMGVRPISTVVDLTNYVMMEMGHPSHAFDLARIPERELHVRWARQGERLTTLDGVERALTPRQGVVAGPQSPLALAGIMGGATSEVSDDTRVVALEAAYWDPLSIRRAARSLAMHTEASHRFERGADPEAPPLATARIAHLLAKIGAGSVRPGLIDQHVAPRPPRRSVFRPGRADALLGVPVPAEESQRILAGLGFTVRESVEGMSVEMPSWRGDASREADLIEEVGRHYGLDKIPSTVPPGRGAEGLRPGQQRLRAVRDALAGAGLVEVITYAFVSDRAADGHVPPRTALRNPLSDEQGVLRTSLVVPGLIGVMQTNLRRGRRDAHLFEVGRVFLAGDEPDWPVKEVQRLGLLMAGSGQPVHWSARPRKADFFDTTGVLHVLGQRLGLPLWELRASSGEDTPRFLHPGKSAQVWSGGQRIGYVGAIHPQQAEAWELRDETVVAELDLDPLLEARPASRFRALPRFPMVARDLSIACATSVPLGELEARIRGAAGELLRDVGVVDRYEGAPLKPGTVSLTVTLQYQHPSRTLTGDEVEASVRRVRDALRGAGCEIRGE